MADPYELGQSIKLTANFVDTNNSAVDPTTVVCKVMDPTGAVTTPSVTKNSTGSYSAVVNIGLAANQAGKWYYRFEGTGSNPATHESMFVVASSRFYS